MTTSVLVIDDDPVARGTIRAILEDEGYSVTCAEDGRGGLAAFHKSRPDVVVIDTVITDKEGIETILELRSIWPEGPIITISGGGHVVKGGFLKLAKSCGAVAALAKPFLSKPFPGHASLTPRERVALAHIVRGASSKEAARALGISPRTVEFHRANVIRKVGAKNTADLVRRVVGE